MCRIWMTFFAVLATLGLSMRVSNAQSDQSLSTSAPLKGEVGSPPNKLDGRTLRTPADLDQTAPDR